MKNILITGTAGFIGHHLVKLLQERGDAVYGIDNINDYYSTQLKEDRLRNQGFTFDADLPFNKEIVASDGISKFKRINLQDREALNEVFEDNRFDVVVNLAAQAGVRYSLENPYAYLDSNIIGFLNLLEACKMHKPKHFVFASTASVYGLNTNFPFDENTDTSHPLSLYAANKKSNEMMAHAYAHLFELPTTGLRFFNAYGPWGRPDMALFIFTQNILQKKPIKIFNYGKMLRDFTFGPDIVQGVAKVIDSPATANESFNTNNPLASSSTAPFRLYNIGNNTPVQLMDFITEIEQNLGIAAIKEFIEIQPGEITKSHANSNSLYETFGYKPTTTVKDGVKQFIEWYKWYYMV